jgi:hypothetical protein
MNTIEQCRRESLRWTSWAEFEEAEAAEWAEVARTAQAPERREKAEGMAERSRRNARAFYGRSQAADEAALRLALAVVSEECAVLVAA